MLYAFIHNVLTGLIVRFNADMKLAENNDLLWKYPTICEFEPEKKAKRLAYQYSSDINDEDLAEEMQHLPLIYESHVGKPELKALELLNLFAEYKLREFFLSSECLY